MNHVAFENNNAVPEIRVRLFVFSVNKVSQLQTRLEKNIVEHINAMLDPRLQEVFIHAFGVRVRIVAAAINDTHVREDHWDKVFVRGQEHDVRDISFNSIDTLN